MRICDRCYEPTQAAQQICLVADDQYFDLCNKHAQELLEFLTTKETPTKKGKKKHSAKAA